MGERADMQAAATACMRACDQVEQLHEQFVDGAFDASKGVSFLELKNQLMLDYLANMTLLLNLKLRGKSIIGHNVVERLVFLKVMMDKLKPLDRKLKYQIDKIVKIAATEDQGAADDALQFRPNPSALRPKDGTADAKDGQGREDGIYQPPKIAAAPYTDDDPAAAREEKRKERERQRLLQSTMMQELRDQISDRPEQIMEYEASQIAHLKGGRQSKRDIEVERYEEDNFIRLNRGKKEKKRSNPRNALADLADFSGFKGFNYAAGELTSDVKRKSVREQISDAKRSKRR
eukprot:m.13097 g.13097  ORF g.13097 m.13097 type:complete len:290 (+) comp7152_c0_seq1:195-1064(+)